MARRPMSKECRELAEAVEAAGGTVQRTAKGHLMVTGPAGSYSVGGAVSNKRHKGRGWANAYAQVRTYTGLDVRRRAA